MDKKLKYLFKRSLCRSMWLSALMLSVGYGYASIDDNTDDCYASARLRFEYVYNLRYTDLFSQQVERLDLYVYNQTDGSLAAVKTYTQAELIEENYSLSLQWLRQGNYNIIAFGNKYERYYEIHDYDRMEELRVSMISSDDEGTVLENPSHFFYGMIQVGAGETGEKIVSMVKNTSDINITVRNDSVTRSEPVEGLPDLRVSVAVQNGTIKQDNSIAEEDTRLMTHISDNAFPQYESQLSTSLTVGRLFSTDGSQVEIKEKDSGRVLSSDNLTQRIVSLLAEDPTYAGMDPGEYIDRRESFDLVYVVEMKEGVLVTTLVTINDWNAEENPIGGI